MLSGAAVRSAALAQQDLNNLSRIQLDDGSNVQNPLSPPPYLSKNNTLRLGASVSYIEGALGYSFAEYEIQPIFQWSSQEANAILSLRRYPTYLKSSR